MTRYTGLKVNDQLVAYATRFLAVRLKNLLWLHHCALKAKVQCDLSSAYLPYHTNVLRLVNINSNIDITQPAINNKVAQFFFHWCVLYSSPLSLISQWILRTRFFPCCYRGHSSRLGAGAHSGKYGDWR